MAQPPGGLCQKIDKQFARRLQSIITLLSVGVQLGPSQAGSTTLSDGDGQGERARSRPSVS